MKIKFIAYNDGHAIFIYNRIKLFPFFLVSLILSFLALIFTFIFSTYELLFVFILPLLFLIFLGIDYLCISYNNKTFLKGKKQKHIFVLEKGLLYKDEKMVKSIDDIQLYRYKKYLFLILRQSYYYIKNDDFIEGNREEFLKLVKYQERHYIYFDLPNLSKEEIADLYFKNLDLDVRVCRFFYTPSKEKIAYIYKNEINSYSIQFEQLEFADEHERLYLHVYAWWVTSNEMSFCSYYDSEETAYRDIENLVKDYLELKKENYHEII